MATFGNTSTSGAAAAGELYDGGSFLCRGKFTLSEAANVSKLSIYLDNQGSGHAACNVRAGIYDDDGASGKAATLKGSKEVSITDNMAVQHVDFTFASPVSLAAGDWWLAIEGNSNAGGCRLYTQTASATFHASYEDYGSDLPDPPTDPFYTNSNTLVCMYATYTVPASGNPHYYYAQQ